MAISQLVDLDTLNSFYTQIRSQMDDRVANTTYDKDEELGTDAFPYKKAYITEIAGGSNSYATEKSIVVNNQIIPSTAVNLGSAVHKFGSAYATTYNGNLVNTLTMEVTGASSATRTFNNSSSATFTVPYATDTTAGTVSTVAQTMKGDKTLKGSLTLGEANATKNLTVTGTGSIGGTLDVDGVTHIKNTTASTGKDSGALQVDGGIGANGDVYATNANFSGTLNAGGTTLGNTSVGTLSTSGLATLASGSVTGALSVGDTLTVTDRATLNGGIGVTGNATVSGTVGMAGGSSSLAFEITDTTASISKTTGALKVKGGVGVEGDIHANNGNLSGTLAVTGNTTLTGTLGVTGKTTVDELSAGDTSLGKTSITDSTVATATDGALKVTGGVKANTLYIGTTSILVGDVSISSNTASATTTEGALKVAGGVGIGGAVNADSGKLGSLSVTGDTILGDDASTDAVTIKGTLGVEGTSTLAGLNATDTEVESLKVTDNTEATSSTGAVNITGGILVGKNAYITGETTHADAVTIDKDTETAGKTSGALVVKGGVGIAKNLYASAGNFSGSMTVGNGLTVSSGDTSLKNTTMGTLSASTGSFSGDVSITSDTDSTSGTTGALKVTGGSYIGKQLRVKGATTLSSTLDVTSKATIGGGASITGETSTTTALIGGGARLSYDSTSGVLTIETGV